MSTLYSVSINSSMQTFAQQRPDLQSLEFLFKPNPAKVKQSKINFLQKVPAHVSVQDNHAIMARQTHKVFREKFNNLL